MASNVVYINFRASTNAADTFKSWNNAPVTAESTLTDMVDEDGNATVFDWTQGIGQGSTLNGVDAVGTGDAVWVDEAIISKEEHWIPDGQTRSFTLSGLNDAKTYELEVFGSRVGTGRSLEISTDGFISSESIDVANNSTLTAILSGVSPSGGAITLEWRPLPGEAAYLGALKFTEIPALPQPRRRHIGFHHA